MSSGLDPTWLAALQAQASQPPLRPRWPLRVAGAVIGSVETAFLDEIAGVPASHGALLLSKEEQSASLAVPAGSSASDQLNALAAAMRERGLAGPWRSEQLAVHALQGDGVGSRIATVERAAVRPLGVPTRAVHLVGWVGGGQAMWVQQRSLTKANDPGQWDTLMGGMVSAADSVELALERETWEEAGLHIAALHAVQHGGQVRIQRPIQDGRGMGYMVEMIDWFTATVPPGVEPVNQDGEVERFELLSRAALVERLHAGAFTLEASLVLAAALAA